MAKSDILPGEETIVDYGEEYFGPGNIDCLCYTCEVMSARTGEACKKWRLRIPTNL